MQKKTKPSDYVYKIQLLEFTEINQNLLTYIKHTDALGGDIQKTWTIRWNLFQCSQTNQQQLDI